MVSLQEWNIWKIFLSQGKYLDKPNDKLSSFCQPLKAHTQKNFKLYFLLSLTFPKYFSSSSYYPYYFPRTLIHYSTIYSQTCHHDHHPFLNSWEPILPTPFIFYMITPIQYLSRNKCRSITLSLSYLFIFFMYRTCLWI